MIKRIFVVGLVVVVVVILVIFKFRKPTPVKKTETLPDITETSKTIIPETPEISQTPELKQCLDKARDFYGLGQFVQSQKQFEDCLLIDPESINAQVSLASILFLRDDYTRAKKEFITALTLTTEKSELAAYIYSMLGDIAIIENDTTQAEKNYSKSLEIVPVNSNAQIGIARVYELKFKWDDAAAGYKRALLWEPCNTKANEGLRRIKPYVMVDGEILADLKERKAPLINETKLAGEDKKLFYKICQSEQMGAIDYIKSKSGFIHPSYIMEKRKNHCILELYLTHKGFEVYRKLITEDAIKLLSKRGVSVKYIFMLRDKKGRRVFDPKLGLLTYDGFNVYYRMLEGETPYILSSEPLSGQGSENLLTMSVDERQVTELEKQGFEQITKAEYIWIKEATDCSQDTLERDLDLKIIRTPQTIHYLIDTLGIRKDLGTFKTLVERYRQGDFSTDISGETHRTFFGTGPQSDTLKLCKKDGTLNI